MTRVLVVDTDETATLRDFAPGDLEAWQQAVGGFIEHLPLSAEVSAMVNEDGVRLELPVNRVASAVAAAFLSLDGRVLNTIGTGIVGPVIFFGTPVEGEAADVPDVVLLLLRRAGINIEAEVTIEEEES
jgi:hypothetical protein